jgi:hypothetical protein
MQSVGRPALTVRSEFHSWSPILLAEQILENLQEPCGLSQMAIAWGFHGSAPAGQHLQRKLHPNSTLRDLTRPAVP